MFEIVRPPPHDVPTLPRPNCGPGSYPGWAMLGFDSRHEAVLTQLLCRYVQPFKASHRETWQVDVGGAYVDFRVCGAFVEYHPVRLKVHLNSNDRSFGHFYSREAHAEYVREFYSRPINEREDFRRSVELELKEKYDRERTEIIRARFPDSEIIFAHNPEEFYLKVLQRFGEELPALREFRQMFKAMLSVYSSGKGNYRVGS